MSTNKNKILAILVIFLSSLITNLSIAAPNEKLVEVTAYTLNVRAAPSAKSPINGHVDKGDRLIVSQVSKYWAKIVSGNNANGFISTKHVKILEQNHTKYDSSILVLISIGGAVFLLIALKATNNKKNQSYKNSASPHRVTYESRNSDEAVGNYIDVQNFPIVKVVRVIDGDTVIVSSSWRQMKIRLDSIDCPEDGQPWGNIATSGLIKLIGGKRVRIQIYGNDHYGRQIATIYVQKKPGGDWINVNEQMVVKGHAWVMRKYYEHLPKNKRDKLNRLERWARNKRVGLWRTSNPVPPWLWRNNQRLI